MQRRPGSNGWDASLSSAKSWQLAAFEAPVKSQLFGRMAATAHCGGQWTAHMSNRKSSSEEFGDTILYWQKRSTDVRRELSMVYLELEVLTNNRSRSAVI